MSRVRNEQLTKDALSVEERDQAVDLWIKYEQGCLRQQSSFKKLYSLLKLFEDSNSIAAETYNFSPPQTIY